MAILTKESATELRRIIKEATGRNISLGEAYDIWHYLLKLLQLLWQIEKRQKNTTSLQPTQSIYQTTKEAPLEFHFQHPSRDRPKMCEVIGLPIFWFFVHWSRFREGTIPRSSYCHLRYKQCEGIRQIVMLLAPKAGKLRN